MPRQAQHHLALILHFMVSQHITLDAWTYAQKSHIQIESQHPIVILQKPQLDE